MNGQEGIVVGGVDGDYLTIEIEEHQYKVTLKPAPKGNLNTEEDAIEAITCDDIVKSFAITVHKSQGSEYRAVVLFLPKGCSKFCTRNLLYTGMSRARERITVIGEMKEIRNIIYNIVGETHDGLSEMMNEE
jgi:exodeoxyribonuclease V alpha subunit